jgi:hypothetical protein
LVLLVRGFEPGVHNPISDGRGVSSTDGFLRFWGYKKGPEPTSGSGPAVPERVKNPPAPCPRGGPWRESPSSRIS